MRYLIIILIVLFCSGCAYSQHEKITEFPNGSKVTVRHTYIVAAPVQPPSVGVEDYRVPKGQLTSASYK